MNNEHVTTSMILKIFTNRSTLRALKAVGERKLECWQFIIHGMCMVHYFNKQSERAKITYISKIF